MLGEPLGTTKEYPKARRRTFDEQAGYLGSWIMHHVQLRLWGYGLRPLLLFRAAAIVVVLSAFLVTTLHCDFFAQGGTRPLSFGEALYTSVVTFATALGYGDHFTRVGLRPDYDGVKPCSGIFSSVFLLHAFTAG